jgi:RNA 3'-terminal phosphate cyclase (ATP)
MLDIDGSIMEGGGQLLRMATSYSAILGEPIRVYNIRENRRDPGLKPQHLATLEVAKLITGAETRGVSIDSREIVFKPKRIRCGDYNFDIGTAGSISLLLQCLNPILLYGGRSSRITVRGGTAVNWSPPLPFLQNIIYMAIKRMGVSVKLNIDRHGFYPRGGGSITQYIDSVERLQPLNLGNPDIKKINGISLCGALPKHVAVRQADSAKKMLNKLRYKISIRPVLAEPSPISPGSFICIWAEGVNVFLGADSLGARGKPAERVGEEAAVKMIKVVRSGVNLDYHTADHIIQPASLADGESIFTTSMITLHTLTAIEIAKLFTDAEFKVTGREGEPGTIKVKGIGFINED